MLTRVPQIVTAAHIDLYSCKHNLLTNPDHKAKIRSPDLHTGHYRKYLYVYTVRLTDLWSPNLHRSCVWYGCTNWQQSPLLWTTFQGYGG